MNMVSSCRILKLEPFITTETNMECRESRFAVAAERVVSKNQERETKDEMNIYNLNCSLNGVDVVFCI